MMGKQRSNSADNEANAKEVKGKNSKKQILFFPQTPK
jgi:hypothetical protein